MKSESAAIVRWLSHSLRVRLAVVSLLAIFGTLLLANSVLTQLFERQVTAQFQANLRVNLDQMAAAIQVQGDPPQLLITEPLGDPRWVKPYSGIYWQINAAESVLPGGMQRSRSLWDYTLSLPNGGLADGTVHIHQVDGPNDQRVMLLARTVLLQEGANSVKAHLMVAADTQSLRDAVEEFRRTVIQYLLVLAVILGAVLVVQVTVGLSPLRELHRALMRLRQGTAKQLQGEFPAEVQPLADSFNTILSEHQRHVERGRTLAGNLAHAVKTPLSVMANAAADTSMSEESLRKTVSTYIALAQSQVSWHMKRARMAASAVTPGSSVEVRPVVDGIVAVMRRAYADKSLAVDVSVPSQGVRFKGEPQDLQEILGNVVDNAYKWADQRVTIGCIDTPDGFAITIDDDGPGVPADQRSAILQRGVRMDELKPGSGLGLAIASELVALYRGQIVFDSSPLGGLSVRLFLPIERP